MGKAIQKKNSVWRMFFDKWDWKCSVYMMFTLSIPLKTHGMRRQTSVKVFRKDTNMYASVNAETSVDVAGTVMIGYNEPFEGFVEIS